MHPSPRDTISRYLHEVAELPNESAKTHRFATLVGELFGGSTAPVEFSRGVEKRVRIHDTERLKHGRIDSYYGNAILEFEASLDRTLADAEYQLREYTAGVWTQEGAQRPLVCIASDGVQWRMYQPVRQKGAGRTVRVDEVRLTPLRSLTLGPATLD